MNKNLMIGVGVAILLLLGIGGYTLMMGKKTNPASTVPTTGEVSPTPAIQSGSLRQLLTGGISQKCTYDAEGNLGTVYVSGGKMRGDMQLTSDDKTVGSHMIVDDTTTYIWMDGQTSGYKMSWDMTTPAPTGAAAQTGFDPDEDVNYNCGPWVSDGRQFTLPAEVTFAEVGKVVLPTGMTPETTPGSQSQCDSCNSLTGTIKTQCLAALGCN
ncbi:hypothetical protein A2899_04860 [Candidatus Amesbacteria bacterium RIFCSPLOWO2_01_FULL_49_25]|uniref:Uncharacterized protein n=1 Tax=Candidatus Amesbacteria bacterium RIFCSPHIGHO2_01_FULL_48_32b TaxID=1797253 RepID=A0A1F4YE42_9BACT|nr:MAG: hypothetical protein A2876_04435 [Candidatus Amesbacteria bacterium RIFCSPHIGHO2_01_FULL_48_32b]OGD07910.1 MAG: hypothetical protein A2899_04860 [Candidatus Amesbacteria bacterium RIFCSPLOWO2_01_FULL_49_25]